MSLYVLFSFNATASTIVSFAILAVIGYWVAVRRSQFVTSESEVVEIDTPLAAAPVTNAPLGRMN